MTDVEGGLDAPDELQPEPGALALASIDDDWTRADWEKAAAAALRKSHRLRDEDPDDAVWATLTRTTYDDIAIPPLGTADLLDDPKILETPVPVSGLVNKWPFHAEAGLDSIVARSPSTWSR